MQISGVTNIVKRKENQDNFWVARLNYSDDEGKSFREIGAACVCDGMGGLSNGEWASYTTVKMVKEHILKNGNISDIDEVLQRANDIIYAAGEKSGGKSGTTCTVIVCGNNRYTVHNIGDSRCYHYRVKDLNGEPEVLQVTEDHTVLQTLRKRGVEITPEMQMMYRNKLVRCVGVTPEVNGDTYEGEYSEGDLFLICSDGFWHTLKNNDFYKGDIADLDSMVQKAIDMGEEDNCTACVIRV